MKKMTCFVMALALVLGLSQCKKEQPLEPTNEGNGVRITLNVENDGNNGSRVNVTDNHVTFQSGDQILVGYNGAYVGTITHNGTRFEGNINATVSGTQPLYFYFVGNKNKTGASINVGDENYTVDISNQTAELPVLSFSESNETFTGGGPYTASLHNQCALVKLSLSNAISTVQLNNRYTTATINFGTPAITRSGEANGTVTFYSKSGTEKWAILLPQDADATASVAIGGSNFTVNMPAIVKNGYVTNIPQIDNSSVSSVIDLSTVTTTAYPDGFTAQDGNVLTGTLGENVKVSIAAGATVTLDGVTINGWSDDADEPSESYVPWAGITCLGNATIILVGENNVTGFHWEYPGVQAGPTSTILTIQGNGSLNASSNGYGAGIGCAWGIDCGNIVIEGGRISATGGWDGGAGIGSAMNSTCGTIEINGGEVTAEGGARSAGIGSSYGGGYVSSCGNITINSGVASVTATSVGSGASPIGAGDHGSCGTVKFGDETMYNGSTWTTTPTNGGTYGGLSLAITTDEDYNVIVNTWTLTPYVAPSAPTGAINGLFSVSATQQVYFSKGNLLDTGDFIDPQYDYYALYDYDDGNDLLQWAESFTSNYSGDWRALTSDEWNYLFTVRTNASNLWGFAYVVNSNGIILLPDGSSLSINTDHSDWDNNEINNTTTWLEMEANGAVFLPAVGYEEGSSVEDTGLKGYYWCSTSGWYMRFGDDDSFEAPTCYGGGSSSRYVRLVLNAQ